MRLVFMGTPEFSVVSLEKLLASKHQVLGVVTQPDRPKGRGMKLAYSPVKTIALTHNLPVYQPESLPDEALMSFLKEVRPEAIVVVAYGLKIPPAILDLPLYGCINLHASLLPKYRGASPIQAVILNGETTTGVTTMKMDEGWDTGDLLLTRTVAIGETETFGTLHDRLAAIGAALLVETLDALEEGKITPQPQDHSAATYVRKLSPEDYILDWSHETVSLYNRIRAFDPMPGARTSLNGEPLKIWAARPGKGWYGLEAAVPGTIGELVKEEEWALPVRTGDGVLLLTELQLPGKKRLTIEQFAAGNTLTAGTVLG